jgi:hypothetical protein
MSDFVMLLGKLPGEKSDFNRGFTGLLRVF